MSRETLCANGCEAFAVPGSPLCHRCANRQGAAARTVQRARVREAPGQMALFAPPAPPPAPRLGDTTTPRARAEDPENAHRAAARAAGDLTLKQKSVLEVITTYGPMHDEHLVHFYREARTQQLARGFGALYPDLTDSSIRSRRNELVGLGMVRDTGRETRTARGGPTTIWEVVPGHERRASA